MERVDTMKNIEGRLDALYHQDAESNVNEEVRLIRGSFDIDDFQDVMGELQLRDADDLVADMSHALAESDDDIERGHLIDTMHEVRNRDALFYDVGLGMIYAEPIDWSHVFDVFHKLSQSDV